LAVADVNGKTAGTFTLPAGVRPYSWSRTGALRILAVQSNQPATLKFLSLADGRESTIPDTNSHLRKGRYAPDGTRYAYESLIDGRYQFVVRDAGTTRSRVLATSADPEGRWAWSPDGAWIGFIVADNGRWLTVLDVRSGAERRLVNLEPNENWRWRSDGRGLQYVSWNAAGGPAEIRAVTVDGRDSRVAQAPSTMTTLDWIALLDDTTFIARQGENGGSRLSAVSMTTGAQRVIYTGKVSRAPSPIVVSPDRKFVAFSVAAPTGGGEQVAVAALDGSASRVVGPPLQCGAGPAAWHADGKHLLVWGYPSCEGEYYEALYLFSLNGDPPRQLTKQSGGGGESSYSLSPDGRTVFYETEVGRGMRSLVELDLGTSLGGRSGPTPSPKRAP
jgi:Tol biopolymer transport system component